MQGLCGAVSGFRARSSQDQRFWPACALTLCHIRLYAHLGRCCCKHVARAAVESDGPAAGFQAGDNTLFRVSRCWEQRSAARYGKSTDSRLEKHQDRLGPPHQHAFGAATAGTAIFAVSKELDENRFTLTTADSSRPIGSGRLNSETVSCSLHPAVVSCYQSTF